MKLDELEEASFSELIELFLSGDVENVNETDPDYCVKAGNELWNKMSGITDIFPLFDSSLETCLQCAVHIGYEGSYEGDEFEGVSQLMLSVSKTQFKWVRYDICRFFYSHWNIKYADLLLRYLQDDEALVKSYAMAYLAKISDHDFNHVKNILTSSKKVTTDISHIFDYFTALRIGENATSDDIAKSSKDDELLHYNDNVSDLTKKRIERLMELRERA